MERGQRVTEIMKQKQYAPLSVADMAISMYAVDRGYLDAVPVKKITDVEKELHACFHVDHPELLALINKTGDFNDDIDRQLKAGIEACLKMITW